MTTQKIVAEETVSVTEMRKHPANYFTDHPIAVLSNNQPLGYMVGKELFETMVELIRRSQPQETFTAQFQPRRLSENSSRNEQPRRPLMFPNENVDHFTKQALRIILAQFLMLFSCALHRYPYRITLLLPSKLLL